MEYTGIIESHSHLRGDEYTTNFLKYGFLDLEAIGVVAVFEQPNPRFTLPNGEQLRLINEETLIIRQKQVEEAQKATNTKHIKHGMHIGITNDFDQVKHALDLVMKNKYNLVSDKIFYVHSTGNMGILDEDYQRYIWMYKGKIGYNGVSIGHFEDEKAFTKIDFDPNMPITHNIKQNPESELIQIERQIKNAFDAKYRGIFYVAHVSNPDSIDYIDTMRSKLPFEVVLESTFHHPLLNTIDVRKYGNLLKMNPPLRERVLQEALFERLLKGRIQIIGTDHAPHPYKNKTSNDPPSGIQTFPFWPRFIEIARKNRMKESLLEDMTFNTPNRIFNLKLKKVKVRREYDPSLWEKYEYNPFEKFDEI